MIFFPEGKEANDFVTQKRGTGGVEGSINII
jgi:hypothetical protein